MRLGRKVFPGLRAACHRRFDKDGIRRSRSERGQYLEIRTILQRALWCVFELEKRSSELLAGCCAFAHVSFTGLVLRSIRNPSSERILSDCPYRYGASQPLLVCRPLWKCAAVEPNVGQPSIAELLVGFRGANDMLCCDRVQLLKKNVSV